MGSFAFDIGAVCTHPNSARLHKVPIGKGQNQHENTTEKTGWTLHLK